MSDERLLACLRLARTKHLGPHGYRALLRRFGTPEAALQALPILAARGGRYEGLRIPATDAIQRELAELADLGGRASVHGDRCWPSLLSEIADPPAALTLLGRPELLNRPAVAVVGARNASAGGQRLTETLARDLAAAGYVVVSGLARGIDAAAHRGALEGGTVAVMAGGADYAYPPENHRLHGEIMRRGLVVSDQPLGTVPHAGHFPRRNRILAGLTLGVVVVEATERSGALITARLAAGNGRQVFAVPGSPRDERSRGPNRLIRDGAGLVESADDVLAVLKSAGARPPPAAGAASDGAAAPQRVDADRGDDGGGAGGGEEGGPGEDGRGDARHRLATALGSDPVEIDELVRRCRIAPAEIQTLLMEMEIEGRIARHPGNRVARA